MYFVNGNRLGKDINFQSVCIALLGFIKITSLYIVEKRHDEDYILQQVLILCNVSNK